MRSPGGGGARAAPAGAGPAAGALAARAGGAGLLAVDPKHPRAVGHVEDGHVLESLPEQSLVLPATGGGVQR